MKKALLILAAASMMLAPSASAAVRGFVAIGGPRIYGGYGGFYSPFWGSYWGPYWGPAYGYSYAPNSGQVKLDTKVKDAEVFLNGSYAGTTAENKSMHLRPGNYSIEIREAGQKRYAESVYVVAGKTLHLRPEL
jgi:hypothetical protein